MDNESIDFDLSFESMPIMCYNTSVISFPKNRVNHSRDKHIDIKHYFIRDYVENGNFVLEFIELENQFADIFTKTFVRGKILFPEKYKPLNTCFKDI